MLNPHQASEMSFLKVGVRTLSVDKSCSHLRQRLTIKRSYQQAPVDASSKTHACMCARWTEAAAQAPSDAQIV